MKKSKQETLRALPSVEKLLNLDSGSELIKKHGRTPVLKALQKAVSSLRASIKENEKNKPPKNINSTIIKNAESIITEGLSANLRPVVNATGIILHTGLGRAVMPPDASEAVASATGCCNIQISLETGKRIKREESIGDLVKELTGAQDALLVNNNAGATLLVLKALAENKETIVSRGELIEIGGSFRLPEIMEQSGAKLREVGSTNKTHLRDYEKAISKDTALLLKAHKSNYQIVGFSKEVDISEIAKLGKKKRIPVVDDLGCGALIDIAQFGVDHEMTVKESLKAGADIVLFSTDKLIGGPQGGLIVGKKKLIDKIRKHPLYRALRVCKMTLAALEATLRTFKSPEFLTEKHPVYTMLAKPEKEMNKQAEKLAKLIAKKKPSWKISIIKEASFIGGGSLPGSKLPSYAVKISSKSISGVNLAKQLRTADIPVVAHLNKNAVILNMRTVSPEEINCIVKAITG